MHNVSNMGDNMEDRMDYSEEDDEEDSDEEGNEGGVGQVYIPGAQKEPADKLECDESAYVLYQKAQTGAPCLSFDIIRDGLGNSREDFPMTLYLVAGTQSAKSVATNSVLVMKMHNLHRTKQKDEAEDDDEESDDSDEEDEAHKPQLNVALINHSGAINRIRATQYGQSQLAASWSDQKKVNIWHLDKTLQLVDDTQVHGKVQDEKPLFSFGGHLAEGFAMDWCQTTPGRLATGDCVKNIHLWEPVEGAGWHVDQRPYVAHTASVEDIQWSPNEPHVFASCSVDHSVRVWDARAAPAKACMLTAADAHEADVNVISWNRNEPFIVSGGDDGVIKVWDLRQFQKGKPVAVFKHHTAPITSVEWHPTDGSVFAASGADDQVTLWDLSVERDDSDPDTLDIPPQLLFIHQGQQDVKELHWHPQLPGVVVTTAHSDFNVFRTISV